MSGCCGSPSSCSGPDLGHDAFVEIGDPVGDIAGKGHLRRDADHGHAFLGQHLQRLEHLTHQLRVKRGWGEIQNDGAAQRVRSDDVVEFVRLGNPGKSGHGDGNRGHGGRCH